MNQSNLMEFKKEDEYGDRLSVEEMMETIVDRSHPVAFDDKELGLYRDEANFHIKNHSLRCPNNLLRHQIGQYCIGHGAGTCDLMVGEFS